jgi:hypothetical protein
MRKPGQRSPYRLRTDGQRKGTALVRAWGWVDHDRGPNWASAERTRSKRYLAGTRRTKKFMRRQRDA